MSENSGIDSNSYSVFFKKTSLKRDDKIDYMICLLKTKDCRDRENGIVNKK